MSRKRSLTERWDSLPKEVRVLPYIALSGAIVGVVDYLTELQVANPLWMGIVNLVIVALKETRDRVRK